jgi:hypothetical protein
MEAGSWADWAAGIVALLALGFSLFQYKTTKPRLDALERKEHRQAERRHAEAVTAWFEAPSVAVVRNAGDAVIYEVIVALRNANSTEESAGPINNQWAAITQLVPPRIEARIEVQQGWGASGFKPAIETAFRDAGGMWWVRGHRGTLSELPGNPYERYGLMLPASYALAEYSK